MRLNELEVGSTVTIKKVDTSCNCILRIMTLGLIEGAKIKCIGSTKNNVLLRIYGNTVAISKHCAKHIVV